ncbi:hypothetical protein EAF04_006073 [Stromatinia cepivora]|nr:hypothetical protein EAF04_006073 [Stromatinia cepivora]
MRDSSIRHCAPSDPMDVIHNVSSKMFTCKPHSEIVVNGRLAEDMRCIPTPRFKRKIDIKEMWESNFRLGHIETLEIHWTIELPLAIRYRRNAWGLHNDWYICR